MGKDFLSLFMEQSAGEESQSKSISSSSEEHLAPPDSSSPPVSESSEEKEVEVTEELQQHLQTTTVSAPDTTVSSTTSSSIVQDEVTDPPTKVISVRVSSTSSVSEATPVKTTPSSDIFTTFLDAFSKTSNKDVTLVTDNDSQITPSSIQRSELSIDEATPSSGPITRSIPSYGSKIVSSRFRPRTSSIYARPRPRQFSPPQSASEPIEVRLSPTATYSVVRFDRNQVRPQVVSAPQQAPSFNIEPQAYQARNYEIQAPKQSEARSLNFQTQEQIYGQPEKVYGQPEKNYAQPEKNYGKPEKVYAEPEKVYGEPEKVYAEPEKVYAQPEQNYGTPERNYGTREQTYEPPARRYGTPVQGYAQPEQNYGQPEQNYEVPESVNVESRGRVHGVVTPSSSAAPEGLQVFDKDLEAQRAAANQKFGYVVEGRNYRKYRVEERTPDGFIVGEYGVVNHNDGMLRGVRYTADGTINPKVIYEALMKFLAL